MGKQSWERALSVRWWNYINLYTLPENMNHNSLLRIYISHVHITGIFLYIVMIRDMIRYIWLIHVMYHILYIYDVVYTMHCYTIAYITDIWPHMILWHSRVCSPYSLLYHLSHISLTPDHSRLRGTFSTTFNLSLLYLLVFAACAALVKHWLGTWPSMPTKYTTSMGNTANSPAPRGYRSCLCVV